jgi:hypothetical protein
MKKNNLEEISKGKKALNLIRIIICNFFLYCAIKVVPDNSVGLRRLNILGELLENEMRGEED